MKISLLSQGYEPTSEFSVGKQLVKLFADKGFHTFTGISAFTSQVGVNDIASHILKAKEHLDNITIVTGVDQRATSKEALVALLELNILSYVFYAPPPFPIFHPKIYLFEGNEKSELIIGSSNLTRPGLFSNVETSLLISIENNIETDIKIVEQLKDYFHGIFDHNDPNLKEITKELIEDLVKTKVVPTEAERKAAQDKEDKTESSENQKILSLIFPKREMAQIPSELKRKSKPKESTRNENTSTKIDIIDNASIIIWESGPLTERDLTIPKKKTSHQTGSMLLKKGLMHGIDQRHYFRDNVFSELDWVFDTNPRLKHIERAVAKFKIIISGIEMGDFELSLSHNTDTSSKTYKEKNCMTSLKWGNARHLITKRELIGLNAQLSKITDKRNEFILEIK